MALDERQRQTFETARKKLMGGDAAGALALLEQLATQAPDEGQVLMALGTTRLVMGNATKVVALVDPLLEKTPAWPSARRLQALARRQLGEWPGALAAAEAWSALDKTDPEALAVQAAAHEALGDAAKAKSLLDRALRQDDDLRETEWIGSLAERLVGNAPDLPLADALAQTYEVTLPPRYAKFLADGDGARHSRIVLSGYFRGEYELDFTSELLTDVAELGVNAGIHDMDDVPWESDYAGYLPIATLSHPDVEEPGIFLVLQAEGEGPVFLFMGEGWSLIPLAPDFASFLAMLPAVSTDITQKFVPGD